MAPQDGRDVTTLQKHADIAMYRAKQDDRNGVRTFQATMGEEAVTRVDVERELCPSCASRGDWDESVGFAMKLQKRPRLSCCVEQSGLTPWASPHPQSELVRASRQDIPPVDEAALLQE
ncbi:hypothetical protein [Deinococcus malanensis]|uniref:hypothetical protein n=1 Tax=Deinococcus malanensis TaxID=1706855 RepID=UPI00402B8B9D